MTSMRWTGLTRARAVALVALGALVWIFPDSSPGGPSPAVGGPIRQISAAEAATLPMVAQAQTTPQAAPTRQPEAVPQADLERQRGEAARQAEQDAADRRAQQQFRRLQDAILRQADEEAAARKAGRRRGETTRQPETARSRPQEVAPVRPPAEPAPAGVQAPPSTPIGRPAEPATAAPRPPPLSAQEVSRIQSQAEQDTAERRAQQQFRRLQDAILRQADEEAAARKAGARRGETTRQPDGARSRPQEVEPVRPPAEPARGGVPPK